MPMEPSPGFPWPKKCTGLHQDLSKLKVHLQCIVVSSLYFVDTFLYFILDMMVSLKVLYKKYTLLSLTFDSSCSKYMVIVELYTRIGYFKLGPNHVLEVNWKKKIKKRLFKISKIISNLLLTLKTANIYRYFFHPPPQIWFQ